MGFYITHTLNR